MKDTILLCTLCNNPVQPFFPTNRSAADRSFLRRTVAYILEEHVSKEMVGFPTDPEVPKNLLNVRMKYLFLDGINKMSRSRFVPSDPLSVKLDNELSTSEGGGPTQEFLALAISQMYSTTAFGGPPSSKVLVLNQEGTV